MQRRRQKARATSRITFGLAAAVCCIATVWHSSEVAAATDAGEPTLVRLSIWMPPENKDAFATVFDSLIAPELLADKPPDLVPSALQGRSTVDSAFTRLYECRGGPEEWIRYYYWPKELLDRDLPPDLRRRFGITDAAFSIYSYPTSAASLPAVNPGPGRGQWRTFGVADGLADLIVTDICEDRNGQLWFATCRGVSRYDGQSFRTYRVEDGLPDNMVPAIIEDSRGDIWVGSGWIWDAEPSGNGAGRFDGERWVRYSTDDGLAGSRVISLLADSRGDVWLGTWNGLSRFDGERFQTYTTEDGLTSNRIAQLAEDADGTLWIGTWGGGLCRYDGNSFESYGTAQGLPPHARDIVGLGLDAKGRLLVGHWAGVRRLVDGHFEPVAPELQRPNTGYHTFHADADGSLWIGSIDQVWGALRIDQDGLTEYLPEDGLADRWVTDIHRDREGHLWFATATGASRYESEYLCTYPSIDMTVADQPLSTFGVQSFYRDRSGQLWMSGHGFSVTSYDGNAYHSYLVPAVREGFVPVSADGAGNLWIPTQVGAIRRSSHTWELFAREDGLPGRRVQALAVDAQGDMWFGTESGAAVLREGRFTPVSPPAGSGREGPTGIGEQRGGGVTAIAHGPDGSVWFGTGRDIVRYDGERFTSIAHPLPGPNRAVRALTVDAHGRVWAAMGDGGVVCIDGDTPQAYTSQSGLAHDVVRAIAQDDRGHLWFGTAGGSISRYDGRSWQTLTAADGLTGGQVYALLATPDGSMWIGSLKGLQRFRCPSPVPPAVQIDAVGADRRYVTPSNVRVPSTVGAVAVEFSSQSLKTRPGAMVYRYRLRGRSDDWSQTREERVEYRDLPRGNYTFEVVAVDRDLVYSEQPAVVRLRVHAPYERIAWSGTLLLALLGIAWQTTRVIRRDRRLHAANSELSTANQALSDANNELFRVNRQVQEANQRLETTNQDLEAANQRITDTNTQLELANQEIQQATQRKSEFLRRMSHDLRTPMNAIIGYTRLVLRKARDVLEPRQIRNLENIQTSAHNLLNLINEILDLSRVEAGRVEIKPQDVDLRELADASADEVASLVPAGVELRRDLTDVPLVRTDPEILRKVLMNLLGNAVKFTENGAIKVAVAPVIAAPPSPAGAVDSTGSAAAGAPAKPAAALDLAAVEIRVSDTGVGIPPEDLPFVFEEFRQVERQGSTEKEGTGLGLAIARKSVELLGGTLMAESEVGRGTTFILAIGHYQEAG